MEHLGGGGAEAHVRFKQYEYGANSNLVLTTDSRHRDTHEPTGEPESLYGKIDPKSSGDRVSKSKPPPAELDDEKLKKKSKTKKKEREQPLVSSDPTTPAKQSNKRRRLQEESSVLTCTDEGVYQPKTKETMAAYEALLGVIQQQFGGQPLNIVCGAADEILAVLKNDAGDAGGSAVANGDDDALDDDDVAVAVKFEENEEESDLDMVYEGEEEGDDDVIEGSGAGGTQMGGGIEDDDMMQEANEGMTLNVQDIDAYWLQRKISQAYEQQIDPQQSQKLAEEVLKILAEGGDDREVETKLLVHLQFDKFSLIKYLLRNRLKIVWCTVYPSRQG